MAEGCGPKLIHSDAPAGGQIGILTPALRWRPSARPRPSGNLPAPQGRYLRLMPFSGRAENTISLLPVFGSAMAINGRWNKPIGPGGGTRRLHQKLASRPAFDGGETGSTRV